MIWREAEEHNGGNAERARIRRRPACDVSLRQKDMLKIEPGKIWVEDLRYAVFWRGRIQRFCERDAFQSASSQHNITSLTDWHRPVEIDPVRLSLLQKSTGGLSRKYNFCNSIPLTVHHWTILWAGLLYRIHRSKRVKVVEKRDCYWRAGIHASHSLYIVEWISEIYALWLAGELVPSILYTGHFVRIGLDAKRLVPQFSIFTTSPNIHHTSF